MIRKRKFLGGNGFSGELHCKIRLSKKHDMRIYYSRRFLDLVFILFWVVVVLVHTHIDTIYTNSNKLNSISSSDIQRMQQYFTMTKKAHTKKEFLHFHWGTHFVNSCLKTFWAWKVCQWHTGQDHPNLLDWPPPSILVCSPKKNSKKKNQSNVFGVIILPLWRCTDVKKCLQRPESHCTTIIKNWK